MKNYEKISVGSDARTELHDKIGLTGSEISVNNLEKGTCVPFIHSHKENEEVYIIVNGSGHVIIDSERIELKKGDFIRISPSAKRQFFASDSEDISFICIQTKENSLEKYTSGDAIVEEVK